ncbi:DUF4424 family protein [Legionella jordanis]|nr:DUF4424 family protein [Legionella jordanis]
MKFCFANDSSAELAAGGLRFVKNPDIELRSEDLYISAKKISVRYVFFNNANKDQDLLIAFPLPDIESYRYDKPFSIFPVDNPANPFNFHSRVNGQEISMDVEQKAIANGLDQTALLNSYHIPLSPAYSKTSSYLSRIPKKDWPKLEKLGLIWIDEYDAGKGMMKVPQPAWTLKATYSWHQRFPAKQEMVIEHEYQPVVGFSAGTSIAAPYAAQQSWYQTFLKKYCIDEHLQKTVAQHVEDGMPGYSENRIAYILKTGANWAKPIGQFHLVIDKGDSNNLLSFCGQNVRRSSPTTFEINKTNFLPTEDLNILILEPNKKDH